MTPLTPNHKFTYVETGRAFRCAPLGPQPVTGERPGFNLPDPPAGPGAGFEQAVRQAIRLVTPARLCPGTFRPSPQPPAKAGPSTDADVKAFAISIGVLRTPDEMGAGERYARWP
ncbi:hypothetical protein GCM10010378_25320 [Streptomyces viridochromogenes]